MAQLPLLGTLFDIFLEAVLRNPWNSLPPAMRRFVGIGLKALATFGAFYLLLTHSVRGADGESMTIAAAIGAHLDEVDPMMFVPFVLLGTLVKFVGIASSMLRWHLLLVGQGIRFNFWHVVGSFLIGRFVGTFLPSTVGLDSYKLYDAARFSGRVVEPAAATAVEKVMGLGGVFLTFLVALPFGYSVLGAAAGPTALITVPVALVTIAAMFLVLFRPRLVEAMLRLVPRIVGGRLERFVGRVSQAASAYRGKGRLLLAVIGLSFVVHFATAAMYYFTARAVGASHASFWQVTFASSIQIFATVMSPFTIAGEGVREIVQALLLAKHIGTSASILSAALGFWAAEALTLTGAIFWWARRADYRPRRIELTVASAADVAA